MEVPWDGVALSLSLQDVLDGVELRTRRSSSSAFTDSPAHSRHGGSPLHYYLPGNAPTQPKMHTYTYMNRKYEVWQEALAPQGSAGSYVWSPRTLKHTCSRIYVRISSAYTSRSVCRGPLCASCFGFCHCDWLRWRQAVRVAGVHRITLSQSPGVPPPPPPPPSKPPSISMCQVGRHPSRWY